PTTSTLFPYTTLFRSVARSFHQRMLYGERSPWTTFAPSISSTSYISHRKAAAACPGDNETSFSCGAALSRSPRYCITITPSETRSEEHTSELQSRVDL